MSYAKQAVTRLTLDMGLPDVQKSVSLTAGDTNRRLEVTLIDKGSPFALPTTWTAILAGVLPSGDELYLSCVVDDGRIVFDFVADNAVSSEEGVFAVAFDVFDEGGELVASPKIWMHVTPSVRRLKDPMVSDRLTALQEFVREINKVNSELSTHAEQIGELEGKITTAGTVTIPTTEWTDGMPTIAKFELDGFGKGMTALLIPADSQTQDAAKEARLSAYPVAFPIDSDTQTVELIRADADKAPTISLRFVYLIIKTYSSVAPTVAIIGVDASGGGITEETKEELVKYVLAALPVYDGEVEEV